MSDLTKLHAVAEAIRLRGEAREKFEVAAAARVEQQLEPFERDVERAVLAALDDEHSVTDVARAYTVSGKTPNRNAIHDIKRKYNVEEREQIQEYPFEWVPREVETARGIVTRYDIHAVLNEYGPDAVSGEFTWRFDGVTGQFELVLTEEEPYPATRFYEAALSRWASMNPYPEDGGQ